MNRRTLALVVLLVSALALPLSASQFIKASFDDLARESQYVVRGEIVSTWSAWDDAREVIYTYATVRVHRYFGETTGPDTLIVREVGGTVEGYTQEAIGFPMLRDNENVVLMLSRWEDGSEFRIHGFNQGKYLVRNKGGIEVLHEDPVKQGDARLHRTELGARQVSEELSMREFATMVDDARSGRNFDRPRQ
ncbi:MAG TPA: hypothetical protein VGF48_13185 [Thermoanaerobaculia bacterium]|jgi:hypothetical protein